MKNNLRLVLISLLLTVSYLCYEYQRPVISQKEAISKAKEFVRIANQQTSLNYNITKPPESIELDNDFVKKFFGNQIWTVFIDGIVVKINAYNGEFIQMTFPMDGIFTMETHREWFK